MKKDKASIGKRNRTSGHAYERKVAALFKLLGFDNVATSRLMSKHADDKGIDLVNTGSFGVQCKYYINRPNYIEVLDAMPKNLLNVLFHRKPRHGTYVTMTEETFIKLITSYLKEHGHEGATNQGVLQSPSDKPKSNKSRTGNSKKRKE